MALFRKHRGSLDESLKTTIIVKSKKDLIRIILDDYNESGYRPIELFGENIEIKIEPYCGLDLRCGWYTQLVMSDAIEKGFFTVSGYLSEPLDE